MNRSFWPAVPFLLAALPCCSTSWQPEEVCGTGEPALDIGSAASAGTTFSPIEADHAVELVRGPQGGFHIWLQLRARNLCPEHLTIQRSTAWSDGTEITEASESLSLIEASDPALAELGWRELPAARPAILCPASRNVTGVPILLKVAVVDSADRSAAAESIVVPACPTGEDAGDCGTMCIPPGA